jgi:hypothetical protein
MKDLFKGIGYLAVIFTIIGSIVYGKDYLDNRYATKAEHQSLKFEVKLNKLHDTYRDALDHMFFYHTQAQKYPNNLEIAKKLKKAQDHVDLIKKQMEELNMRGSD